MLAVGLVVSLAALAGARGLEGPFVLWGPPDLLNLRRPALEPLRQDELLHLYAPPRALVLFGRPPTRANLPRLRTLLKEAPTLYAPQDFLDVHPDYVNNETQTITVQGPDSEQDAEITEKFQRMEDVYGKGNVLAILGNSCPEDLLIDEDIENTNLEIMKKLELRRQRRQIIQDMYDGVGMTAQIVYNDKGKTLLFTTDYPTIRYKYAENNSNDEEIKLKQLKVITGDDRGMLSKMILSFTVDDGRKVTLRFRFIEAVGYWTMGPVELVDGTRELLLLNPPKTDEFMGAPKGFSYHCGNSFVFSNESALMNVTLTLKDLQVQPLLEKSERFGSAYDCVGFTTVPIWSGILVTLMIVGCLAAAIFMISEIKTMDRFENSKGKTLTFTTYE